MTHEPTRPPRSGSVGWLSVAAGLVIVVGVIDWATGTEVRVFPLYYGPIAIAALHAGRAGALGTAAACSATWLLANRLAPGAHGAFPVWLVNTMVQLLSFALFGWLVASLRAAGAAARAQARTDPLTGLLNSRAFYEALEREVQRARRYERPLTVAYLDLDDFKAVNDSLGHLEGDALLRSVAGAVLRALRSTDVAARLGGDEFAVILPEVAPDGAPATLERLRAALSQRVAELPCRVTFSIGAASYSGQPPDAEALVAAADAAMYRAKRAGRDRVVVDALAPASRSAARP